MVKWSSIYATIAADNGVSVTYVMQIHKGTRNANSNKAREILRRLENAKIAIDELRARVAA